ncbi:MAG: hypothetical protein OEY10_00065 [Nitrosopumilus sp.]|nr:hypothetical protein [Nitrosopumilus sp.]
MNTTEQTELESVVKLNKDLKKALSGISINEARFLVASYYAMQDRRIMTDNQIRSLQESTEPHEVLNWFSKNNHTLENQIKLALDIYTKSSELGQWARNNIGIGPVIAAGLIAHIDITKAPTAGHIWSYAGINGPCQEYQGMPNERIQKWEKGQKRPWNAELKALCWKMGEAFVKTSNNEKSFYGKLYKTKKLKEIALNDTLAFKAQAEAVLANKRIGKDTDAYKYYTAGKLPPAHIHARARRYAVKMFLSHFHQVAYYLHYNEMPPLPFAIAHGGHAHFIDVPGFDFIKKAS